MGVKDKPSDQDKEKSPPNPIGNPNIQLNSKRTFEEFKQSVHSSSLSNHDSDSEFDEEEKIDFSFEISEQIDCLGPDTLWRNAEIISVS